MDFIETTITEHVYNQGWIKGEIKGEVKGRKETAVNLLNMGIDVGIISQATGFNEKEIKQLTAL
jgi:predicted transposase YdaD